MGQLAVLDQLAEVLQVPQLHLALAGVEILQQQPEGVCSDLPVAEGDGLSVLPLLLEHLAQQRAPSAQQKLVTAHCLAVDVEFDVFAALVLPESPQELCVGLAPLREGCM